jgi:hypothetical protein
MSHFTVMIFGSNIEKQLQPFHEYECTGIEDEYVQFVEAKESLEELQNKHKEKYPNLSFEDFLMDWYGYKIENNKIGKLTNPNAKWDWWQLGGRWSGMLKLKSDIDSSEYCKGEPGVFGGKNDGKQYVDSTYKRNIDIKSMRLEAYNNAITEYDKFEKTIKGLELPPKWEEFKKGMNIEEARQLYSNYESIKALKEANLMPLWDSIEDKYFIGKGGRKAYIQKAVNNCLTTFAVIKDGQWFEKGSMGWWGITTNEDDNWETKFAELFDSISDDMLISIVDCHI